MFEDGALNDLCRRYGTRYDAGDVIVHEQEPTTDLYFVLSGEVEFSAGDRVLGRGGRGTLFGEVSCFGGLPRSATATAAGDAVLLKFDQATAMQLVSTSPRFALRIIQTLGDRLRGATPRGDLPAPMAPVAGSRRPMTIRQVIRASS